MLKKRGIYIFVSVVGVGKERNLSFLDENVFYYRVNATDGEWAAAQTTHCKKRPNLTGKHQK